MKKKLPVFRLLREGITLPFKHSWSLIMACWPVLVTVMVSWALVASNLPKEEVVFLPSERPSRIGFQVFILAIMYMLSGVMAAVSCHRIFLLGKESAKENNLFNWTGNEGKYFGWLVVLLVMSFLYVIAIKLFPMSLLSPVLNLFKALNAVIPESMNISVTLDLLIPDEYVGTEIPLIYAIFTILFFVLVIGPMLYIFARLALVLPSSAIGEHGRSPVWSWRISKGNGWRLTFILFVVPLFSGYIFKLILIDNVWIAGLVNNLAWAITSAIEICMLSLSYRFLVEEPVD